MLGRERAAATRHASGRRSCPSRFSALRSWRACRGLRTWRVPHRDPPLLPRLQHATLPRPLGQCLSACGSHCRAGSQCWAVSQAVARQEDSKWALQELPSPTPPEEENQHAGQAVAVALAVAQGRMAPVPAPRLRVASAYVIADDGRQGWLQAFHGAVPESVSGMPEKARDRAGGFCVRSDVCTFSSTIAIVLRVLLVTLAVPGGIFPSLFFRC